MIPTTVPTIPTIEKTNAATWIHVGTPSLAIAAIPAPSSMLQTLDPGSDTSAVWNRTFKHPGHFGDPIDWKRRRNVSEPRAQKGNSPELTERAVRLVPL